MRTLIILILFISAPVFGQLQKPTDTLKIVGKYKGVDISFNPWDKSYTLQDTISVFATSIIKTLVNGIVYSDPITYPWTIELSKLGFKKNDNITILLICSDKRKFQINPPKGFKVVR